MKRLTILSLVVLAGAMLAPPATRLASAWQAPANQVQNPGFEGGFFPWSGINEVQVAHGWTPWWRNRTDEDPATHYFRPEYKQASGYIYPNRVHGGASAQQWFTFHATHQAGMYQQVSNVTPGTRYRFSVWVQVWSSTEDDPSRSVNPADADLRVGIDPTGQWNPWAGTVVWSGSASFFDRWGQLTVEAVAQNTVITVFLHSAPAWPVKHNDTYWDDAALVAVGEGQPPAPPTAIPPTSPPGPAPSTPTPVQPPPPTPTCAPAPTDWVVYSVQRGDTLYGLARKSGTSLDQVISVNCLSTTDILVGQRLLLPRLPATDTPSAPTRTPEPAAATATVSLSSTPTREATTEPSTTPTPLRETATATKIPATTIPTATSTAPPTALRATATPSAISAATATATTGQPTIAPPATNTPGSPVPPPTSTPLGGSTRPCGTIAVGAGLVLAAGILVYRRKGDG